MSSPRRRTRFPKSEIVTGVRPDDVSPRTVAKDFRASLDDGARIVPAGEAKDDPLRLLDEGYGPRHRVTLFDTTFCLSDYRHDLNIDFLVAYVGPHDARGRVRRWYPRIFYKDVSLIWRTASHVSGSGEDSWIGKGDTVIEERGDGEYEASAEETTNLPYELQTSLDIVSRGKKSRRDDDAIFLVLRHAVGDRVRAYADFTGPRDRANALHPVNGGRSVARITRRGVPESLRFTRGYEPDLASGILEVDVSGSRLYGGELEKYRVASTNRRVQYQFVASPTHVFINPPQTLTRNLTTFGQRPLDVPHDDDAFVPGYEYHYLDESVDPPELYSQIPEGFAGETSPDDETRACAKAWIERLPVIREFRRKVLRKRR